MSETNNQNQTQASPDLSKPENFVDFKGDLDELYKAVIAHKGLSVVKYGLTTCPPCRALRASLPKLAAENPDVMFFNVEMDDKPGMSWRLWIFMVPQTYFYKGEKKGEPIRLDYLRGFQLSAIKAKIAQYK